MRKKVVQFFERYPELKSFIKNPLYWLYSAYLTLRYIDEYDTFPAIRFHGILNFRIIKGSSSFIKIKGRLIIEPWLNGNGRTSVILSEYSSLKINGDFIIGDDVRIYLSKGAELVIGGKYKESGSGITAKSVVMVNKRVEIGKDCLIAWNTFITDCDWHAIEGKPSSQETMIADKVWLGVGASVLKGANISRDSIITSYSVVLRGDYPRSCLIAGNPARVVKSLIPEWHREMED
jgi:acetyltransferase-like isoleucine patch superfamily enzyme